MDKESLLLLEEKIKSLTEEEIKKRYVYLKGLNDGTIQGPMTNYATIDMPWLKWYREEGFNIQTQGNNVYDQFLLCTDEYKNSNHTLLEYETRKYTRDDIEKEVENYIKYFTSQGLKNGDVVSFIMIDTPEILFMWYALSKMGVISNMIKIDEGIDRINYMINSTNSKMVFISEIPFMLDIMHEVCKENNGIEKVVTVPIFDSLNSIQKINMLIKKINDAKTNELNIIESIKKTIMPLRNNIKEINNKILSEKKFIKLTDWKKENESVEKNIIVNGGENVSVIVYTGGTTGKAKGVQLTNDNLNSMIDAFYYGEYGFTPDKTSMNILPPGIAYYFNATHALISLGVDVRLIPAFTIEEYPKLIQQYKPNIFMAGPVLFEEMKKANIIDDASFVTAAISGGDKLHLSEELDDNEYFKNHNSNAIVHQGYGESESTAAAAYSKTDAYVPGTIGIPFVNSKIGIFDYDTGEEVHGYGKDHIGEICISGPSLMKGYLNNKEATDLVLRKHNDGSVWLHTDDFGYMDNQGRLFHMGRAKRMLTRNGAKVWLGEIEETAMSIVGVNNCCCVRFNDIEEREIPVLYLEIDDSADINGIAEQIDNAISNKYPSTYIPKYYTKIDEIPYTLVNKKCDFKKLENEPLFDENEYQINGKIIERKEKIKR